MNNKGETPGSSVGKESACNARDPGLILGLGRSPGEGNSYPLQYSSLENSMDLYSQWGHKELDMTEQISLKKIMFKLCKEHELCFD